MEITQKLVEDRKAELQSDIDALMAQRDEIINKLNAYHGALQDCDFWLKQLKEDSPPPPQPLDQTKSG